MTELLLTDIIRHGNKVITSETESNRSRKAYALKRSREIARAMDMFRKERNGV